MIMFNPIYYFEFIYNRLLDMMHLTPNYIVDNYITKYKQNKFIILDLYDTDLINEIQVLENLRWNIFYKKYGR